MKKTWNNDVQWFMYTFSLDWVGNLVSTTIGINFIHNGTEIKEQDA